MLRDEIPVITLENTIATVGWKTLFRAFVRWLAVLGALKYGKMETLIFRLLSVGQTVLQPIRAALYDLFVVSKNHAWFGRSTLRH